MFAARLSVNVRVCRVQEKCHNTLCNIIRLTLLISLTLWRPMWKNTTNKHSDVFVI